MKKIDAFQLAFLISLFLHFTAFTVYSILNIRKEPDFKDYTLVQLVNTMPKAAITTAVKNETAVSQPKESGNILPDHPEALSENTGSPSAGSDQEYSTYVPFFQVMKLPEFITKVRPAYPPKAKLSQKEAEVLVEVYIDINGKPRKVVVLKSGGQEFDDSTIDAVSKSLFSPAISKEGRAIPVRVRIPFKFELE